MTEEVIRFTAQVEKVTTLTDGGIRIVLDIAETEIEVAKQMMVVRQQGALLEVAAVPVLQRITGENGEIRKGTERKSKWQTPEEPGIN